VAETAGRTAQPSAFIRHMKTKMFLQFFGAFALLNALCLFFAGCVSSTATAPAPSDRQQLVANAVEDTLSVGLVPVLAKNRDYVAIAQSIAAALGTFSGDTLTAADVSAFLGKTNLAPEDATTIAALVNAAWDTYTRRYAQQVSANVRPDVKLFLGAVSSGIKRAIAALPPAVAASDHIRARDYVQMANWLESYRRDPGDSMTIEQYDAWERVENELRDRAERKRNRTL